MSAWVTGTTDEEGSPRALQPLLLQVVTVVKNKKGV